jgi:hypothetical protein
LLSAKELSGFFLWAKSLAVELHINSQQGVFTTMSVKVIIRAVPLQFLPDFSFAAGLLSGILDSLRLLLHLLKPASMAFFLLAAWRFSQDLGWTADFLISEGTFSHWQVWAALGFALLAIHSEVEKRDLTMPASLPADSR